MRILYPFESFIWIRKILTFRGAFTGLGASKVMDIMKPRGFTGLDQFVQPHDMERELRPER